MDFLPTIWEIFMLNVFKKYKSHGSSGIERTLHDFSGVSESSRLMALTI